MRVPVDWLGDYVELPDGVSGAQIAADLVAVGLEEEGLHGGDVTGPLVVGRVLEKHPEPQKNGKTINWCQVDVGPANGTGEPQGIVCGASNFAVGDLVVVVLPGGVLPGGFEISARKTYGHVSSGMICSSRELGLGDDHDGIMVLPEGTGAPGDDAFDALHHPSYVDFFEEVLSTSTDPQVIEKQFEERYATDPWYVHLYRTSYAYHGVHPFYMWYWIAHALDHLGSGRNVVWVGGDRKACARMGFRAASSLADALEMVSDVVGDDPSITYLHNPPHLVADVT